jgi:DNA-binding NarL/FixJ family response regulator
MIDSTEVKKLIGVRVLALCGESLLIEGLEASLQDREGVEIVRLNIVRSSAFQVLDKLSPDVIVFDLTPSQLSCVFTFWRSHRDVVLIGFDIDHDLALVLSGEWRRLPSVGDLMQVIEGRIQVKNAS